MSGDATTVYVIAKYDYRAQESQELSLRKLERLSLLDDSRNWWKVANDQGQIGYVPSNYVRKEAAAKATNGVNIFDKVKGALTPRSSSSRNDENFQQASSSNGQHNPPLMANRFVLDSQGNRLNCADPTAAAATANTANTITPLTYARVKYSYEPQRDDELRLTKASTVTVLEKCSDGWWRGQFNDDVGWFPSNYVVDTSLLDDAATDNKLPPSPTANGAVIETVRCLYTFTAQNTEELSFEKGERLDIIEHPAHDPEWWRAVNVRGQTGLVPTNYIQVVQQHHSPQTNGGGVTEVQHAKTASQTSLGPSATPADYRRRCAGAVFRDKPWYYGRMTRETADNLLNAYGADGDFLVRDSESNPGDFSISLKAAVRNKHFWVHVDTSAESGRAQYKIGNRHFANMDELVEHYTVQPIYTNDKTGEKLYLVQALPP